MALSEAPAPFRPRTFVRETKFKFYAAADECIG